MTTPDRLAAAVAQGHEDAVQVGPQEGGAPDAAEVHPQALVGLLPASLVRDVGAWANGTDPRLLQTVLAVALHREGLLATPAPVSSPAGEDVERVARVLDPSAFNPTASVPICFGQTPESAREEAQEAARDEARRVLAALAATPAARPVEAQEVEEEWGYQWATFVDGPVDRTSGPMPKAEALALIDRDDENRRRGFNSGPARLVRRTVTPWVPVETGGEGR